MTLSLAQANAACRYQDQMDTKHANLFAAALPHFDTDLDTTAIRQFEAYAVEHQLTDALNFLHEAISPSHMAATLGGVSGATRLEYRLCGF